MTPGIQLKSESVRKVIFWVLIIALGIIFFAFWLILAKQKIKDLNGERLKREMNLPELENKLKNLPSLESLEVKPPEIKE